MTTAPKATLLGALVLVGSLWLALPGAATHKTVYENTTLNDQAAHSYNELTLRNVNGTLGNATVNGPFRITSSASGVTRDFTLKNSNLNGAVSANQSAYNLRFENVTIGVGYRVTLDNIHDVLVKRGTFRDVTVKGGSYGVTFNATTFTGCVTVNGSTTPTPSFVGTTPSNPLCQTSSPTPTNSTTPTPSPTTSSYPTTTYTYSPPPTRTTYSVAPPPAGDYKQYVGVTHSSDVHAASCDRVMLRDATIHGNVFIGLSSNVVLERVTVTGQVHIDNSVNIAVSNARVGGMFGLSYATNFKVVDSSVGGFLGCYKCVHGTYQNVRVAYEVNIVDSSDVQRFNVEAFADVGERPKPTTEPLPGPIGIQVDGGSMVLTVPKLVAPRLGDEVSINVDAIRGRAKLEVPQPKDPDRPAIKLDTDFVKVLEIEDRNGDGAFDLSDHVVHEFMIDELPLANIYQERLEDGSGYRGRIDYHLDTGTFSLVFTARDDVPDRTKIDIEFHDYPYANERTQLVLQVSLASASDWEVVDAGDEDRLVFRGTGVDGYFSWIRTVTADGVDLPVTARVLEEHRSASGERQIVLLLGYPHANDLVHDPSLGLLDPEAVQQIGNLLVYGVTFVAVVVVLWAMGASARRRAP